ncbi:MAG: PAS domain-containing protein, partial [Myxococcales bacterium]
MGAVLLVHLDDSLAQRLAAGRSGYVRAEEPALTRLEPEAYDAVVVGPDLEAPVQAAQRVHAVDRDLGVVLLAAPGEERELQRAVQFAPFLGPEVRCLASTDPALRERVVGVAEQTRSRREYRRLISSVRLPTREQPPPFEAEYFDRLLQAAPVGILLLDGQGRIRAVNRAGAALAGSSERALLGTALDELLGEANAREVSRLAGGADAAGAAQLRLDRGRVLEAVAA